MPKTKTKRLSRFNKLKLPKSRSSRVRLGLFVVAFALIGAYLIFASYAAYLSTSAEGVQYNDINSTRAQNGRAGLAYNSCLTNVARRWAQQLSAQGHGGDNPNFQNDLNSCFGSGWRAGGENSGGAWENTSTSWPCNDSDQSCSQGVFDCFMQECGYNGTGHRDNILSTAYTTVGVGAYRDDRNVLWIVQAFASCASTCPYNSTAPSAGTYSPPPPPPPPAPEYRALSVAPCVGGYTMDVEGGLHPFNGFGSASGAPYWPNQNYARMVAIDPSCSGQGYLLDLYGGIHNFNNAPPVHGEGYWPGKDVARDLKFYNWNTHQGYVLDPLGALHPVNYAPAAHVSGYWPSGDVTRKFALNGAGTGGYTLDYRGGLHPFSTGSNAMPQGTYGGPYWSGDVARGLVLDPNGHGGYVLDYCGGIQPFAVNGYSMPPKITNITWYDCSADLARDIVVTVWNKDNTGQPGGYVVDKKGGVHIFGPSSAATQGISLKQITFTTFVGQQSGRCIDDTASNTANLTSIIIYDCYGTSNQKWGFGSDGTMRLSLNPNKCLDDTASNTANGTQLILYDCYGTLNQRWSLKSDNRIHSVLNNNKCIAANGSSNLSKLIIYDCNSSSNELWVRR